MSDTDDDLMPNNIEFFNRKTGMSDHAPSLIHSNLTSGVYQNNVIAPKYNLPNKYLSFGQPSIYSRRETSPMSLRSLPVSRMQSQNSYYQSQVNSQGSIYKERCRSPMSLRSIGSNATVTIDNILFSLKHSSFNKCELRRIKDACQILLGGRSRRKIGKRRHLKSILKLYGRKSGGESGVEGSDSSRSSDDCRSTRSTYYKDNFPLRRTRPLLADCNKYTTKTSLNDIYEDRSENFKQNSLRNLLIPNNKTGTHRPMQYDRQRYLTYDRYNNIHQNITHSDKYSEIKENRPHINFSEKSKNVSETDRSIINPQHIVNDNIQNESDVTLKDRFTKSSFLLPSQRFRTAVAHSTSYEVSFKVKSKKNQPNASDSNKSDDINEENSITNKQTETAEQNRRRYESDTENYEIFSRNTGIENTMHSKSMNHKRIIESEDMTYPERKRNKLNLSSKIRNQTESLKIIKLKNNKDKDDSNFKKPQLPVRKNNFLKRSLNTDSEILIAKSSQPLVGVVSKETVPQISTTLEETHTRQETRKLSQTTINTNDISMTDTIQNSSTMSKPSFIKRKLFTQNLDIVDSKNLSDPLYGNSPQPKTLRACREKNKVRKLVTSQSCLSRDVHGENNVIDLIHKIVPPDQINVTSALSKQDALSSTHEDEDKWDVMSIISRSKIDDGSDTYSDQEIFDPQEGNKENKNGHKENNKEARKAKCGITKDNNRTKQPKESDLTKNKHTRQVSVVIHRVSDIEMQEQKKPKKVCPIKTFWDTDLSEVDDINSPLKMKSQERQKPKKVGLVKSFWDTDSEVEDHVQTVRRTVREEETGRHNLRNTAKLSIYNNRIQNNTNTKNIVNSSINSNTKGQKITESKNISNRITRSRSQSEEALVDVQIQDSRNSKLEAKRMIKEKTPKTSVKPSSSKEKKKEESSNNLNSSRQSRRIQEKKNKNNASNLILDKSMDLLVKPDNCNRSRESVRLKQKRERSNSMQKMK